MIHVVFIALFTISCAQNNDGDSNENVPKQNMIMNSIIAQHVCVRFLAASFKKSEHYILFYADCYYIWFLKHLPPKWIEMILKT